MSLINTRIQNIRSGSNLDKYEFRASRYGALDLFAMQSQDPAGIITPELVQKAEASIGNTLQTPVIDFDAGISIGSSRSVTIADSENTSQLITISFATYAWGFTIVPALYMNNEVSIQRDFETKFMKYLYEFANTLDTAAVAALEANKTAVFGDLLLYANVANAVQAAWTEREQFVGDINPLMAANDYYGQLHVVGNTGIESMIRKLAEKGLYNSENKQLQFGDKILHFTNRIANGVGVFGTGYAVNGGSVGMLNRFEREVLLNGKARTGHEWSRERLPLIDMEVGTYFYESVGDFNAIAGAASADMDRVRKEHYGFAVDVAFLTAYNSDSVTKPEPIMKVELLAAV